MSILEGTNFKNAPSVKLTLIIVRTFNIFHLIWSDKIPYTLKEIYKLYFVMLNCYFLKALSICSLAVLLYKAEFTSISRENQILNYIQYISPMTLKAFYAIQ